MVGGRAGAAAGSSADLESPAAGAEVAAAEGILARRGVLSSGWSPGSVLGGVNAPLGGMVRWTEEEQKEDEQEEEEKQEEEELEQLQ